MKKLHLRIAGLMSVVLLFSACVAQKTPQEVAQVFWESVLNNETKDAVKYSTLTDAREYDGFSRDWSGFQPSWGKIVIEGKEASIVSEFSRPDNSSANSRKFETYLVRQNEEWKVDYARTAEELRGGAFTRLIGEFDQLGKKISDQFKSSAKDISAEMERMSEQFEELSDSIGQQASKSIKRYGKDLRWSIDELADSVQRALKEQEWRLSDRDRRVLSEVVADLNECSEKLSRPSMQSIADGGKSVGIAQLQLESMDDEIVGKYKEQWHEWGVRFEADMHKILDELRQNPQL